ncbi:MAG: GlsB/YeaQ/YmgE family stress response membrane protein [Anaerolineales bacterium]|nr:GlsB/YeaQ/YmgE family stress response membrane protein [Anaerolineales bacterium]
MGILTWIVFGALAGWIASLIMKTDRQMGAVANIVVGIAGAFIGGFIMENFLGQAGVNGFNLYSLLVAIGGAALLIWLVGLISGRRSRRRR